MQRIKSLNLLVIIAIIATMFSFITPVDAAASATVGFSGNSTVAVGDNITVKMYISNVTDTVGGIVSAGGNLSFDSSYLEYISGTGISSPYTFQINPSANYIIAGLDTTLSNGITGSGQTTVFTFVFKALKEGSTQVTLTNAKLSDTSAKITTNVVAKTITIGSSSNNNTTTQPTKSSDSTLKSLSVTGYTLSPSFSANTTSYTVKVPSSATSVKIEGTANNSKSSVNGLGNITLTGDSTTATIKVTAEDGSTKTYTINIEKESTLDSTKDSDATLKSLDVSGYTLSPAFKKNITTYSMKVKNSITALNVSTVANSDKATVSISGNKNWKVGVNVVTIKVTAEDGTVNNYTVNVTREGTGENSTTTAKKSSDNYLKSLIINSSHEINPTFNKDVTNYDLTVPSDVDSLDLTYVTNNSKSKVEVSGNKDFKIGEVNTVQVKVTAEDGSIRIYTLNVTRSTEESDTDLKDLIIDGVTLSPTFDPTVLEYTTKVGSDIDKLDIKATAEADGAKVEIIGNEDLKEGKNLVLVKVTDKNGFSKYYTIEVEKEKKEVSILGLTPLQFGVISSIIGLLLLALLILLFKRKKVKKIIKEDEKPVVPIIEVKPEFNFGSKNTSDDDIVHGNFKQSGDNTPQSFDDEDIIDYEDYEDKLPYDPYDETVTKRELIDAIHEATKTRNVSKLKMLLEQDALNQKKKEMKKREELRRKERDIDDWRE